MPKKSEFLKKNAVNSTSNFTPKKRAPYIMQKDAIRRKNAVDQVTVLSVNPKEVTNWSFHDRPENEFGDIDKLAKELKNIGQQQPCVVRCIEHKDPQIKYELIIGERRWKAAQIANINLKVIVNNISDDEAAIAQVVENDSRLDLSDYAKGMSFSKLIKQNIIKQKDITERLGKSKQYVSALLSYAKIPTEICQAIGDMSKIKYYAAEKIKQLSQQGSEYITALISIGNKMSTKGMSAKNIENNVNKILNPSGCMKEISKKEFTKDGRHIFTWRSDNNGLPSLHFPKQIIVTINNGTDNFKNITEGFIKIIENELKKINM